MIFFFLFILWCHCIFLILSLALLFIIFVILLCILHFNLLLLLNYDIIVFSSFCDSFQWLENSKRKETNKSSSSSSSPFHDITVFSSFQASSSSYDISFLFWKMKEKNKSNFSSSSTVHAFSPHIVILFFL